MTATLIYATAASKEEAMAIGRAMVESRLAACANIIPAITSCYWWEGKLQESQEAALILKTRRELAGKAIARVKELHSYDCPCIIAFDIGKGHPDFIKWIVSETAQHID